MSIAELEKLTVTKLKEDAREYPEITGATGMKKSDLINAILKARGEPVKKEKKEPVLIAGIKKNIRVLKKEREKALAEKDSKKISQIRIQIKKLKRQSRQIANKKKKPEKKS